MSDESLIGKVRFEPFGTEFDTYGQSKPETLQASYHYVRAPVGANHHMIQEEGSTDFKVMPNEKLTSGSWWSSLDEAKSAFERHKAKRIANQ